MKAIVDAQSEGLFLTAGLHGVPWPSFVNLLRLLMLGPKGVMHSFAFAPGSVTPNASQFKVGKMNHGSIMSLKQGKKVDEAT